MFEISIVIVVQTTNDERRTANDEQQHLAIIAKSKIIERTSIGGASVGGIRQVQSFCSVL
jgi:hypothetical protein